MPSPVVAIAVLMFGASLVTAGVVVARGPSAPNAAPSVQSPTGTGFTYQGRLDQAGSPANGTFDFQFRLHSDPDEESQAGSALTHEDIEVRNGLFAAKLDFGSDVFTGEARWLEIGVRPGESEPDTPFTILSPRQELSPTPYSIHALSAGNADTVDGQHASDLLDKATYDTNTDGRVDQADSVPWSGLSGVPDAFADGIDNDAISELSCRVGQSAIWKGTSWECVNLFGFTITTLDSPGLIGSYTDIAIGTDGMALISYRNFTAGDLMVAHCHNLVCSSATIIRTLDYLADVGQYTSIVIGSDGRGLISYYDLTNRDLKIAHCTDVPCTTAFVTTLDSGGDVGRWTSITIGGDGLGLISYYDVTNTSLKVAHCRDILCTTATITTLDNAGDVGAYSSIATGADGLGVVSYYDRTFGRLTVAHCQDAACTAATITRVFGVPGGAWTSIAAGENGRFDISHVDVSSGSVWLTQCSDYCASAGSFRFVSNRQITDTALGFDTSIAIRNDGCAVVSYYDNLLKSLMWASPQCDGLLGQIVLERAAGDTGTFASLAIGSDGLGLIAYHNTVTDDLKAIHCVSPTTCKPQ